MMCPYFDCGRTGLVGTVGVTVLDSSGASHVARTTAGITEPVSGSGTYYVADHDAAATLTYVWDMGIGTMAASETLYAGREGDAYAEAALVHAHVATIETQTSAASIAAAVWNALVASYTTAVSFGRYLGGAPTGATVSADIIAVQATVDGIGTAGGAAINTDAAGDNASAGRPGVTVATTKVGTQTGTYVNASNVNGVYHVITHAANAIDWVYEFRCGGGTTPVSVAWTGYLVSGNDTIQVAAWSYTLGAWVNIGSIVGQAGTANIIRTFTLYPRHIGGVGAELGKVYIRFYCTGMSSPVLNTDQLTVSYAVTSRSVGYADGAIWIDTLDGVAGSELFVNGTADNPVRTYADAELLETALGINRFHIRNGSTLTISGLVNDLVEHTFLGSGWTLVMTNDLDVSNAYIEGAHISGASVCTSGDATFSGCEFGDVTLGSAVIRDSLLGGTFTTRADGLYTLINCSDGLPGTGNNPGVVFAADVGFAARYWSGGIELKGLTLGCFCAIGGLGRVVINADCTGGQIVVRGNIDLTDQGGVPGTFDALADGSLVDTARSAEDQSLANVVNTDRLLMNRVVTDPETHMMSVYDDAGTAVLYEADVFEDVAGTVPYTGAHGINRRDRLVEPPA